MDRNEALAELRRRAEDPAHAADREKILSAIGRSSRISALSGPGASDPTPRDQIPQEDVPDTVGARLKRGGGRLVDALDVPARLANRAVDTATFGAYGRINDGLSRLSGHRIGTSPEQDAELQREHPILAGTADAIGYLSPSGGAGRLGEAAGRGVDALTSALVRRQAASTGGKIAERAVKGAATGALAAGGTHDIEAVVRGELPTEAGQSMASGAAFGAGFGAASEAAGAGEAAMRRGNPDLQVLHEHGLEPSPIPGRPVVREDRPYIEQLPGVTEPPLGVSRATQGTRGAAARRAAEPILKDMDVRARANNERFGEMQRQAYKEQGRNPAQIDHLIEHIDQQLADPGMGDTAKAGLRAAKARITTNSVQTKAGTFMTAENLDGIRDYVDGLGHREVAVEKVKQGDVPFRQLSDAMRASLEGVAPKIAELNSQQHKVLTGLEDRYENLGFGRKSRVEPTKRNAKTASKTIRRNGEDTASAGSEEGDVAGLYTQGSPDVLPGADVPAQRGYGASLDVPRLQLAQERLQMMPSAVFSGAGKSATMSLAHIPGAVATRGAYPAMRSLSRMEPGENVVAADLLTRAVRQRGKKKRTEGAETSP